MKAAAAGMPAKISACNKRNRSQLTAEPSAKATSNKDI
jgi:hypothetical protein